MAQTKELPIATSEANACGCGCNGGCGCGGGAESTAAPTDDRTVKLAN